jgi:ArsR family transcriptional regulator, arsenate/arsenite/antimonite-responsive transcriptional repressor
MARAKLAVVGHIGPPESGEPLSNSYGLAALAALGQPTRLEIFRLLMRHEPDGLPAGTIAETIGCPQNTLSSHMAILARAQLTYGTRSGRSIIYRANVKGMRALVDFLISDCCEGHPQVCNFREIFDPEKRSKPARKTPKRKK